jgi:hypothetical protein
MPAPAPTSPSPAAQVPQDGKKIKKEIRTFQVGNDLSDPLIVRARAFTGVPSAEARKILEGLQNPHIILDEPSEVYHGSGAFGSHSLKDFSYATGGSPLYFKARYIDKITPPLDTKALRYGRGLHSLLLEGHQALLDYFVVPPADIALGKNGAHNTGEWDAFVTTQESAGLTPMKRKEMETIIQHAEMVHSHLAYGMKTGSDHAHWLRHGIPETTFRITDPESGLLLQCRPDNIHIEWLGKGQIPFYDLKSTSNISAFRHVDVGRDYLIRQMGHYQHVISVVLGIDPNDVIPVLMPTEKEIPHPIEAVDFTTNDLITARERNREDRMRIADAIQSNRWEQFPSKTRTVKRPFTYERLDANTDLPQESAI